MSHDPADPEHQFGSIDDEIVLDTDVAPEGKFIVPEGDYEARVEDLLNKPSASGNPMLTWVFRLLGEKGKGMKIYHRTVTTQAAMWKVTEVTLALGLSKPGEKAKFKRSEAIGRRCILNLKESEYNGEKRMEAKRIKAHADGPIDNSPF